MYNHTADFIIRLKNRKKRRLTLYNRKETKKILNLLKKEGYLFFNFVSIDLKYICIEISKDLIKEILLISSNSRPIYKNYNDLLTDPRINGSYGFYILTNSE